MTRKIRSGFLSITCLLANISAMAVEQPTLSETVQPFIRVQSPTLVLTHVRVIDGTGKPAVADQNVTLDHGKIVRIEPATPVTASPETSVLDLTGYSVMPGIVGLYNDLYYQTLPNVQPGFGDQREIELLVEAGFTPVEAIRIATLNGATYAGRQGTIGSIEVGKNADIQNTEIVFKDGVGYDSAKLLRSVAGRYGQY